MKIDKKILFISLFMFFGVMFLMNSQCFASTIEITSNDSTYNVVIPDSLEMKEYYSFLKFYNNWMKSYYYLFITSSEPISIDTSPSIGLRMNCADCLFAFNDTYDFSSCNFSGGSYVNGNAERVSIISSTCDMYDFDGNLVFQVPPIVETTTLAPILEVTPLEGVMKEIMEILPIVLVIIVGLISLRKGLQILSTVLHRS